MDLSPMRLEWRGVLALLALQGVTERSVLPKDHRFQQANILALLCYTFFKGWGTKK
jgi:hypothetical protein